MTHIRIAHYSVVHYAVTTCYKRGALLIPRVSIFFCNNINIVLQYCFMKTNIRLEVTTIFESTSLTYVKFFFYIYVAVHNNKYILM